jgi:hypothetical protein
MDFDLNFRPRSPLRAKRCTAATTGLTLHIEIVGAGRAKVKCCQRRCPQEHSGRVAKREEVIYLDGNEDEPVVLDRRSPVLHLIQLIRDESHASPSATIASAEPCATATRSY